MCLKEIGCVPCDPVNFSWIQLNLRWNVRRIKRLGKYAELVARLIKVYIKKCLRIMLKVAFKFEWWHTSPIENRDYANAIIKRVSDHEPKNIVLEIGCGLGDIISALDFKNRFFFDISENVLEAARFLKFFRNFNSKSNDFFQIFDLFSNSIDESIQCDVVIMVNWIHAFDSARLAPKIENLVNTNMRSGSLLIFDVIPEKANETFSGKTFHHEIEDLINEKYFEVEVLEDYRFGRSIVIARLI